MRILCLHGRGAHDDIFRMQLGPIRAALDTYEFEFVQGQYPFQEEHGMLYAKQFAGSKLYSYYNDLDLEDILRTEEEVLQLAFEDGPYDGIIGYSQGAQLAEQAILRFQRENPNATIDEQPFRFAVLFGGPTPNAVVHTPEPLPPMNEAVYEDKEFNMFLFMNRENPRLRNLSVAGVNAIDLLRTTQQIKIPMSPEKAEGPPLWAATLPSGRRTVTDGERAIYKLDADIDGQVINKIATLHVRSLGDFVEFGEGTYKLCDPALARQYFHQFKHDFPRGHTQMREIAELIRATAEDPRIQ